jgi:hypothetical protein
MVVVRELDTGRTAPDAKRDVGDFIQDPVRFSRERGIDEGVLVKNYLAKLEAKLQPVIGLPPVHGRLATLAPPSVRQVEYPARDDVDTTSPHMGPVVMLAAVAAGAAVVGAAAAVVVALVALGLVRPNPPPKQS